MRIELHLLQHTFVFIHNIFQVLHISKFFNSSWTCQKKLLDDNINGSWLTLGIIISYITKLRLDWWLLSILEVKF